MATALRQFDKLQVGLESSAAKGTLVAATDQLLANWEIPEEIDREYSNFPRGVAATVGGTGIIVRQGTMLNLDMMLTPEEMPYLLSCGLLGDLAPAGPTDFAYIFTPGLTTSVKTLETLTVEAIIGDGTTNHYAREFGHVMLQSYRAQWAANSRASLTAQLFGRAVQTTTPTAALVPIATREELATALTSVFSDTTWAGLGGSQLTGMVRSISIDVDTGLRPKYTIDNRGDKDMSGYDVAPISGSMQMTLDLDANGASYITDWRAGTQHYIRVLAAGAGNSLVQHDMSVRLTGVSTSDENDGMRRVSVDGELVYDATGTKMLEVTCTNQIAAL